MSPHEKLSGVSPTGVIFDEADDIQNEAPAREFFKKVLEQAGVDPDGLGGRRYFVTTSVHSSKQGG